jgi:putative DNA primase/helicase
MVNVTYRGKKASDFNAARTPLRIVSGGKGTERSDPADSPMLAPALLYASRDWSVLRIVPQGKVPLKKGGYKDATTDEATIRELWRDRPDANLGVATGEASGFFALDVDPRHGGDKTLCRLEDEHGPLPPTLTQKTGGGGFHYFFRHVDGVRNSASQLGKGLDVRGDGGHIVVAPSVHPSGGIYEFDDLDADIAEAPPWLIDMIMARRPSVGSPARPRVGPSESGDVIPAGARNTTLTSLAGAMRRRGTGEDAMAALLLAENTSKCRPPLPDREVLGIVRSIMNYPSGGFFQCTDAGNADRLAARYGKTLRYCPAWKKWLIWDGTRWRPDDRRTVMRCAVETARSIKEEVEQ